MLLTNELAFGFALGIGFCAYSWLCVFFGWKVREDHDERGNKK